MQWCFPTTNERESKLPGDHWIDAPKIVTTHAITIETHCEQVWPWVVQIGQNKGGFYSYTFLENLIGCQMKNADRIVEAWQHLKVDDSVLVHPSAPPLQVLSLEKNNHLVLSQLSPLRWSWSFKLKEIPSQKTRLIIRTRVTWNQRINSLWLFPLFKYGHYVMERKMLAGIKHRCESQKNRQSDQAMSQ